MLKSNNIDERVAKAEAVKARLEILEIGRMTGNLTPEQAATEYSACLELASFI
jgi:16S rRNA A1518/A1519 N6-dimethyltransferase RsmA/KsgA/DIM1 with predicted DNA glycosylase/AP lyase activity